METTMTGKFKRGFALVALAAAALLSNRTAIAQDYPSRPVSIIVPLPAGTVADLVARALAEDLAPIFKQPVTVDNRPSASQIVASSQLARAAPNGYTLMISAMPNVIAPSVLKTQNFAGNTDFVAVSHILWITTVLSVSNNLPVSNVREFISLLKANPGKYMYASAGVGTPMHMYLENFNRMAGTQSVHVPYKSFQLVIPDVTSGEVSYTFLPMSAIQFAKAGKLKVLGAAGLKRDPSYPEIPTVDEEGLRGFEAPIHYLVTAPKGTPSDVVSKINAAINTVISRESFAARFKAIGGITVAPAGTPQQAADVLKREDERFTALVREGRVSLD
jgi:tripartite-type tricarboxylate transporter receptor subunit TctC